MQTITDDDKILLDRIYFDTSGQHQGAFSVARPLFLEARKRNPKIRLKTIKLYLQSIEPYLLHRRALRKIQRRSLMVLYPNHIWACDTVYFVKDNHQKTYALHVYDCFTHLSKARALKDKSAREVLVQFKDILSELKAQPKFLFIDEGKQCRY